MTRYLLLLCFTLSLISVSAQSWTTVDESGIRSNGERKIVPRQYLIVRIDDNELQSALALAPLKNVNSRERGSTLKVMLRDGVVDDFNILEYKMMEPSLAAKYPSIKTYYGQSMTNPHRSIRIDHTRNGFRAVVEDQNGRTYIDPYQTNDSSLRIIYKKSEMSPRDGWSCELESDLKAKVTPSSIRQQGDCSFRTYRLAVAATGEYTAFHGGTVGDGIAAIATTINRVNQIYEQDLAASFILVANNDQIVYTNASTDPYNNSSASTAINQNQTNIDAEIGFANYDVGHVFTTGAGGLAGLGVICTASKARGVTGIAAPTGDPFDIDYVSHELGHQFGGPHTFNGTIGNCTGGNRSQLSSFEPGSGSTIMAYAGICGSDNLQNNSDAYFHAKSIESMKAVMMTASCQTTPSFSNSAPVVGVLNNYNVPDSTFLRLEGSATDVDDDPLTYIWEQIDAGGDNPSVPSPTKTEGPQFRSLFHSPSPIRYLPSIDNVINNSSDPWEVLSTVSRDLNFRFTVRDAALGPGCTSEADMTISVDGNSGPFLVQNSSIPAMVQEGQILTVQWDVAGTSGAPVNCSNVEILMSTDGGLTYTQVLLASTPNDGSETVVIPAGLTTTARIMVKAVDNIFFDINDSDFEVEAGGEGFTIAIDPSSVMSCNNAEIQVTVATSAIGGFTDDIVLSTDQLPPGSSSSFSVNPVSPGASSVLTISDLASNSGLFDIEVEGVSGPISRLLTLSLTLEVPLVTPSLVSPADNATGLDVAPTLSWNSVNTASTYDYQVSSGAGGVGIVNQGNVSGASAITSGLLPNQTYYWRVRAVNACGNSAWSSDRSFTTETCIELSFENLEVPIVRDNRLISGPTLSSSTMNLDFDGIITDLDVIHIEGTHERMRDLEFRLYGPDEDDHLIHFFSDCGGTDDFDFSADDEAASNTFPCPPTTGMSYIPDEPFTDYDGLNARGDWALRIYNHSSRTGELNSWGLKLCFDQQECDLTVDSNGQTGDGSLLDAIECASAGDIITLESSLAGQNINLGAANMIFSKNLTITADPADDITISYTGLASAIVIEDGIVVRLSGFTLEHSSVTSEAINCQGTLTTENISINQN